MFQVLPVHASAGQSPDIATLQLGIRFAGPHEFGKDQILQTDEPRRNTGEIDLPAA